MVARKESISLSGTKFGFGFLKWFIPLLLGGSIITGGAKYDEMIEKRFAIIEENCFSNQLDLKGTKIKLENYDIQFREMKEDIRETRKTSEQILIILTKRK